MSWFRRSTSCFDGDPSACCSPFSYSIRFRLRHGSPSLRLSRMSTRFPASVIPERPSRMNLAEIRQLLRAELETEARRLISCWFPRCVDHEHGGFLCDFDHRWRPKG